MKRVWLFFAGLPILGLSGRIQAMALTFRLGCFMKTMVAGLLLLVGGSTMAGDVNVTFGSTGATLRAVKTAPDNWQWSWPKMGAYLTVTYKPGWWSVSWAGGVADLRGSGKDSGGPTIFVIRDAYNLDTVTVTPLP